MLEFIFVYLLGGFTFLPLACLIYIRFLSIKQQEQIENKKQEYKQHTSEVKHGWIQLTNQYEPKMPEQNGILSLTSSNMYYGVLKHGTLFCYESEKEDNVCKILPIQDYLISLYPEGKPENELFSRSSVIRLGDIQSDTTYFLNCSRKVDKEDWYLGLIDAHNMLKDSPNEAQYVMMDSTHFDASAIEDLIYHVQSTPSHRETAWMNAIIGRLFLGMYKTDMFKEWVETKVKKKINTKRPQFLDEITVRKVDVGQTVPYITDPKLVSITAEGEIVAEATVEYQGGLAVEIQTDINWSYSSRMKPIRMNVVLSVQLKKLFGRMMLKLKSPPSNRCWLAFYDMPEMEWKITPIVADKQITLSIVTNAIESRIREVMAETFVLPNMDDTPFCFSCGKGGIFGNRVPVIAKKQSRKAEKHSQKIEVIDTSASVKSAPASMESTENEHRWSNTLLRKRSKNTDEASDTESISSIKSNGSGFLRKISDYLPSESPSSSHSIRSIRRNTLINKAEDFLNKRITKQSSASLPSLYVGDNYQVLDAEKKQMYEERLASMRKRAAAAAATATAVVVEEEQQQENHDLEGSTKTQIPSMASVKQGRQRATSCVNEASVTRSVSLTVKPPLPPRRNSTHIVLHKYPTKSTAFS
ncbi:hypothetical protein BCV72DRAFT_92740 [Rhizopus microsporus var. microsporus]|uniref:SMP-LTD domain-containing protein n=1 Tax=Rhizopus microsporus var. microsporus TaxID=86635 RepID=A0A1X0R899_RHIZD|nr:hypothetical protein BCV72DRAFT_92740 [Rhizopus microsporus var. microsporus]